MNCPSIQKLIPLYLDQQLAPEQFKLVKAHLTNCPDCQQEVDLYNRSWELLNNIKEIEPSPDYVSRFWTEVSHLRAWYEKYLPALPPWAQPGWRLSVVFSFGLVIVTTFFIWKNFDLYQLDAKLAKLDPQEMEVVENIELAQNFEVIEEMELLEDFDLLVDCEFLKSS